MFRKRANKLLFTLMVVMAVMLAWGSVASAADPFLGQITMFGGNFAPRGWANCDGQLLPISSNTALFSLLGTIYGGDGRTTFALPDLRGRVAMHVGNGAGLTNRPQGQKSGTETNTLHVGQMPQHKHNVTATAGGYSGDGDQEGPGGNVWAKKNRDDDYAAVQVDAADPSILLVPDVDMAPEAITVTEQNMGNNQAINNMQPFTVIRYIIALQGVFPSRS